LIGANAVDFIAKETVRTIIFVSTTVTLVLAAFLAYRMEKWRLAETLRRVEFYLFIACGIVVVFLVQLIFAEGDCSSPPEFPSWMKDTCSALAPFWHWIDR
jgi:hypothetical protein